MGLFEERVKGLGAGVANIINAMPADQRQQLREQLDTERTELDSGTGELKGIKLIIDAVLDGIK